MLTAELTDVGLFGSMPRYGDLAMHAVIDLRRSFSQAELAGAAEAVIAAFPVMGRRYETRFWRDRWARVAGPVGEMVHVVAEPADLEAETRSWVRRAIVTTRERPFRLVSLGRGAGSRLILSIMHLAVDGAGVAAVGHVLGAHLYGVPPSLPVDGRRGVGSALGRLRWYHLPVLARDVAGTLLQPLRTRAAARRERPFPAGNPGEPSYRHLVISAAELGPVKARCRARGASINDVLIAALARVSAGRSSGGAVAVLYTMDLRRYAAAPRLSAANNSSILTVVVPRRAIGDLATTAGAVAAVTAGHRRGLIGPAFVVTPLLLAAGSPHAFVRRFMRALHPVVVDMPLRRGLLVTNVGRLDEGLGAFGEDIEDLRVIGPNIEGLNVPAVVAFGFRDQLHVELFAAPGVATAALDELEAELRAALELAPLAG
jgi:NRPS condensation-like uncharacterized protein